jgi:hypothetical protein
MLECRKTPHRQPICGWRAATRRTLATRMQRSWIVTIADTSRLASKRKLILIQTTVFEAAACRWVVVHGAPHARPERAFKVCLQRVCGTAPRASIEDSLRADF